MRDTFESRDRPTLLCDVDCILSTCPGGTGHTRIHTSDMVSLGSLGLIVESLISAFVPWRLRLRLRPPMRDRSDRESDLDCKNPREKK